MEKRAERQKLVKEVLGVRKQQVEVLRRAVDTVRAAGGLEKKARTAMRRLAELAGPGENDDVEGMFESPRVDAVPWSTGDLLEMIGEYPQELTQSRIDRKTQLMLKYLEEQQ